MTELESASSGSEDDDSMSEGEEGSEDGQMGQDQGYEIDSDQELQEAFAAGLIKPGLTRLVPKRKERPKINNIQGLKQKLAELKPAKNMRWLERLEMVNHPAPLAPELALAENKAAEKSKKSAKDPQALKTPEAMVHNDFKREMIFYRQGQAAVMEALPRLKSMGIKTKRPDDYFAQMAKTDIQMNKIRQKLVSKQATEERLEKIRKLRELRKFGKKVQVEVQQKRQKEKSDMLEQVKKFRKGEKESIDFLEEDGGKKAKQQQRKEEQENKAAAMRRKSKDRKFGFGGKKKGTKGNTRASADDISAYRPGVKKPRGPPGGGPAGKKAQGGKSAKNMNMGSKLKQKRLGKARRKATGKGR